MIFNVDEGDVNFIDIDSRNFEVYSVGDEEVTVFVAQEFSTDFISEIEENVHNSMEVTLDEAAKKSLAEKLVDPCGRDDEEYWAQCEIEHGRLTVDV